MTPPETNVVAIAGAGTGKTTFLVQHALVALASARVTADALAAITFTERAGAELRERLTGSLEELLRVAEGAQPRDSKAGRIAALAWKELGETASAGGRDLPALRAACRGALDRIENAFIGTIHGFCADLLRRYPLEARVDPYFRVDDGLAWQRFHEERWPRFLADELGTASQGEGAWERLLRRAGLKDLGRIGRALCSFEIPLDRIGTPGEENATIARLLVPMAAQLSSRLEAFETGKLNRVPRERSVAWRTCFGRLVSGDLESFRSALRSNPSTLEEVPDLGKSYEPGLPRPEAEVLLKRARDFCKAVSALDPDLIEDVQAVLIPWARRMQEEGCRAGLLGFAALLSLTRDLLLRDGDVREAEKGRWRLLLVDEFQDTDPIQYEIVLLLSEQSGVTGLDPFRTPLEPGKLIVVGDPKQSIYRFRRAVIDI
jgi:ATP-dependent helicase/nuclease subunit A